MLLSPLALPGKPGVGVATGGSREPIVQNLHNKSSSKEQQTASYGGQTPTLFANTLTFSPD